ncbi:MAG: permease-like cell division protein FtsX [Oscillospiraceae bacterium]
MKRINTGYYLKEGFRAIFTHGFMSFAAVCMIVACLLIMGTFSLVAVNLEHNLTKLEDENEFVAYIDESLSEEEARALQSKIEAIPNVASATFMTREEARSNFLEDYDNALFSDVPASKFRHRFYIHVTDIEQLDDTVKQVAALPQVANYNAAFEVADGLVTARNVAGGIAVILIAILFLISLFIIANTIKLATFTRREEIAIMKMCGATNAFIRWPFVFEGLILGLIGAAVAFFLQWGVYALISNSVAAGTGMLSFIEIVPFKQMATRVLGIFAGAGFVIGVGGSLLAIRKFLQV